MQCTALYTIFPFIDLCAVSFLKIFIHNFGLTQHVFTRDRCNHTLPFRQGFVLLCLLTLFRTCLFQQINTLSTKSISQVYFAVTAVANTLCTTLYHATRRNHKTQVLVYTPLFSEVYWVKPKFNLARHVTSRHDTTRSTCRTRRDERVEPCCSTSSTAKMHGIDTSNVSCRVLSRRDVTSQVEFGRNSIANALQALSNEDSCSAL